MLDGQRPLHLCEVLCPVSCATDDFISLDQLFTQWFYVLLSPNLLISHVYGHLGWRGDQGSSPRRELGTILKFSHLRICSFNLWSTRIKVQFVN